MNEVGADADLVGAAHEAQIIDELIRLGRHGARLCPGRSHGKAARHRDGHEAVNRDRDVADAQIGVIEERHVVLADVGAVVGDAERVDGVRAQQVRIADDQRVNRVVDRPVGVRQHVVRVIVRLRPVLGQLVPPEDRVGVAPLVVDPAERDVFRSSPFLRSKKLWPQSLIGFGSRPARFTAAGENRAGDTCWFTNGVRSGMVPPGVARRRRDRREVARQHRGRRHELEHARGRHVDTRALVPPK